MSLPIKNILLKSMGEVVNRVVLFPSEIYINSVLHIGVFEQNLADFPIKFACHPSYMSNWSKTYPIPKNFQDIKVETYDGIINCRNSKKALEFSRSFTLPLIELDIIELNKLTKEECHHQLEKAIKQLQETSYII